MNTGNITQVLRQISIGDRNTWTDLMQLIYDDLNQNAAVFMSHENRGHCLQPSDLVHEAYLRLQKQTRVQWQNRTHFFAVASMVMERILIEHARRNHHVTSLSTNLLGDAVSGTLTSIDEVRAAITKLEQLNDEQALIVRLRFFGGLTVDEIADVLAKPKRTVEREWTFIKSWFKRELEMKNNTK